MSKFYIMVEIEYRDFTNATDGKVKIKHDFDTPQDTLERLLMLCIKDFYAQTNGREIVNMKVIDIAYY